MGFFRELKPSEIDCRVSNINAYYVTLLLYKDARVDQNLLDETFGVFGWERKHELIGGNLFCTVSVFDKDTGRWISKQDVGKESYTEAEKGQASDAFKRACFNFGIGRALYTAPEVKVKACDVDIQDKNGKQTTYNKFAVKDIEYEDGVITKLTIINTSKDNAEVFRYLQKPAKEPKKDKPKDVTKADKKPVIEAPKGVAEAEYRTRVIKFINDMNFSEDDKAVICKSFAKSKPFLDWSVGECQSYIRFIESKGGNI